MKNRTFFVAIAMLASAAAVADTDRYSATLAQPLEKKKELIAEHNVWSCDLSTCVLVSAPTDPDSVNSCRRLRRQVGAVTAYGKASKPFDDRKLAACNS